jgi:galactokinase
MARHLGDMTDPGSIAAIVRGRGLTEPAAEAKGLLFARCAEALIATGVGREASPATLFVPGRIEVLGKHTDYAGGRSLVAAADRGICAVAVPRGDDALNVIATDLGKSASFRLSTTPAAAPGDWSNYPATAARRLVRNFPDALRGMDIAFAGDLPRASGMSSSSTIIIATAMAMMAVNELTEREEYRTNIASRADLAGYLATIENGSDFGSLRGDRGVGTFGGSEDHTAILCCRRGALSQYSYCPVRLEREIALPEDKVFAVASSGVEADKTGSAREKYNRASALASLVVRAWNDATHRRDAHMASAIASSPDAPTQMRRVLSDSDLGEGSPEALMSRFDQFHAESEEILPAAGDALLAGDFAEFGRQVDRSQKLTEELLGNQVPETVFLAHSARETGATAASAFGAGFGGSVWAMVDASEADSFLRDWRQAYAKAFPKAEGQSEFFQTRPGPSAFEGI